MTENVSDQKHDFHLSNLIQADINDLLKMREVYHKNPVLGYLSINYLRNNIVSLKDVVDKIPVDILCIDQTKLNDIFQIHSFALNISPSHISIFLKRQKLFDSKSVYVRQGLISKRLQNFLQYRKRSGV